MCMWNSSLLANISNHDPDDKYSEATGIPQSNTIFLLYNQPKINCSWRKNVTISNRIT